MLGARQHYTHFTFSCIIESLQQPYEEGSIIIGSFSDGSTKEIEIGSGKYESKIEDKSILSSFYNTHT